MRTISLGSLGLAIQEFVAVTGTTPRRVVRHPGVGVERDPDGGGTACGLPVEDDPEMPAGGVALLSDGIGMEGI